MGEVYCGGNVGGGINLVSVKIPKEITEYTEKIVAGLSARQLVCLGLALAAGGGAFVISKFVIGLSMDASSYVVMAAAIPFLATGFLKRNGMPFEKYMRLFFRHMFGTSKRPYKTRLDIENIGEDVYDVSDKKARAGEKDSRQDRALQEALEFAITKKGRKAARQRAKRTIKRAKQDFCAAGSRATKGS